MDSRSPDPSPREERGPAFQDLERMLTQLQLVEVLYRRLVGLQARRLAPDGPGETLAAEVARLQARLAEELRELEGLGCQVAPTDARPGEGTPEIPDVWPPD